MKKYKHTFGILMANFQLNLGQRIDPFIWLKGDMQRFFAQLIKSSF